jgi:drug/metabolite transporter (DMT)-like permease
MKNKKVLSWILLVLIALIWGSSFILIKKGLVVYGPGEVGALRILAACLFLVPISIPKIRKLKFQEMKLLFIIGLVGSFVPAFLFAIAQTQLDSGITGALNGLTPVFVLIMGALFFGQKISKAAAIGVVIAFAGTLTLIVAGSGTGGISSLNYYALFVVLATICYGINVNVIKYYLKGLSALVITSVSLLFMGPLAGLYLLYGTDFVNKIATVEGGLKAAGYISLLGVMGTAIALVLFNYLVKITSPIFASSVTYLIPIVALSWGVWDGETLVMGQVSGIALVLFGVYITNKKKAKTNLS